MHNATLVLLCAIAAGLSACGNPESGVYACDIPGNGEHKCVEYAWSGGQQPTGDWENQCQMSNGHEVAACSHTGAVIGCSTANQAAKIVVTFTVWWYYGTADSLQAACAAIGGTFQKP